MTEIVEKKLETFFIFCFKGFCRENFHMKAIYRQEILIILQSRKPQKNMMFRKRTQKKRKISPSIHCATFQSHWSNEHIG